MVTLFTIHCKIDVCISAIGANHSLSETRMLKIGGSSGRGSAMVGVRLCS